MFYFPFNFRLKIFNTQFIVSAAKNAKALVIFSIIFDLKTFFIKLKEFKKSIIRSPHVDKKSKEKFIQSQLTLRISFKPNKMKNFWLKDTLLKSSLMENINKSFSKIKILTFIKKFYV